MPFAWCSGLVLWNIIMLKWRKCDLKVKSELILSVKTCITDWGAGIRVDKPLEEKWELTEAFIHTQIKSSDFCSKMNMPVSSRGATCCLYNPGQQTFSWIWWLKRSAGLCLVPYGEGVREGGGGILPGPFLPGCLCPGGFICRMPLSCHSRLLIVHWRFLVCPFAVR